MKNNKLKNYLFVSKRIEKTGTVKGVEINDPNKYLLFRKAWAPNKEKIIAGLIIGILLSLHIFMNSFSLDLNSYLDGNTLTQLTIETSISYLFLPMAIIMVASNFIKIFNSKTIAYENEKSGLTVGASLMFVFPFIDFLINVVMRYFANNSEYVNGVQTISNYFNISYYLGFSFLLTTIALWMVDEGKHNKVFIIISMLYMPIVIALYTYLIKDFNHQYYMTPLTWIIGHILLLTLKNNTEES